MMCAFFHSFGSNQPLWIIFLFCIHICDFLCVQTIGCQFASVYTDAIQPNMSISLIDQWLSILTDHHGRRMSGNKEGVFPAEIPFLILCPVKQEVRNIIIL